MGGPLGGCGDDGREAGGAGGETNTSGAGGAGASQAGGAGGDGAGGDSAGGGALGGAGGAGPSDDRIYPLEVGRSWTFEVEELNDYPFCPTGTYAVTVQGASPLDGKEALEVTNVCDLLPFDYLAVDGDFVEIRDQQAWQPMLDVPIEEGHTWSSALGSFTWTAVGNVEVPAGVFTDCWRVEHNVVDPDFVEYCRGVGPVHYYLRDLQTGDGFEALLSSKNF
ncbi:MAG: hypothetical protein U0271_31435 [Polyangiaceae bacterium]